MAQRITEEFMRPNNHVTQPSPAAPRRGSRQTAVGLVMLCAATAAGFAGAVGLGSGAVRAADAPADWHALDESAQGFRVHLPAKPRKSEHEIKTPEGKVKLQQWTCPVTGGAFLVFASDYPQAPADGAAIEARLDRERDDIVRSAGGTLRSETRITLDGVPGRELVVDMPGESGSFRVRLFLKGARLHVLGAVTAQSKETAPDVERFLGSFGWSGG